jgi:hypothetical protein
MQRAFGFSWPQARDLRAARFWRNTRASVRPGARPTESRGCDFGHANPKRDTKGVYHLDAVYVDDGNAVVALQLHKAGLRLAKVLNNALAKSS